MKKTLKIIRGKQRKIGSGSYRVVYNLGNGYIIKLAKRKKGIQSNKREVRLYRSAASKLKKHLGKIVSFGSKYEWLIMKKYSRKLPRSPKYRRQLTQVRKKFKRSGIRPHDTNTHRFRNVRLKPNGRIVIIDYGNFRKRKKK